MLAKFVIKQVVLSMLFCCSFFGYSQDKTTTEIHLLLQKAKEEQSTNLLESITATKKIIPKAVLLNDTELLSQTYYLLSNAYYTLDSLQKAKIYCDSTLMLNNIKRKTKANALLLAGVIQRKQGNFKHAENYVKNAIRLFKEISYKDGLNDGYYTLGKILHSEGENQKALSYYLKSLTYYESKNNKLKQGILLGLISALYAEINQPNKAEEYNKQSIELLSAFPNSPYYADALNNQGIFCYDKKNYSKAVKYFARALDIYKILKRPTAIAAAEQNLGISYAQLGFFKEGLTNLHLSYKTFKNLKLKDEVSVLTDLGTAHAIAKNVDSAQYYFTLAYQQANKKNYAYYIKENLRLLYRLFEDNNNYKDAFYYHKLYTSYRDNLENNKLKNTIANLEIKYETAKKEKEIINLKNKEIISKTNTRLLLIALVSSLIIFLLIVYKILHERKKNSEIQKQKNIIRKKEEEQLKKELEIKTKQLAAHALNMMQKNTLLKDISDQITEKTKNNYSVNKQDLISIKKHLEKGLKIDEDWKIFKIYFEQINDSFFLKLKKINPNLTGNDFKLSALLKLNMSLKEMASVLHITPNSVKNARYRLKKKLHLSENEDLKKFISEL